ncbi:hypothetical protein CPAR01_11069, partial [Colletotrichum paranaense]
QIFPLICLLLLQAALLTLGAPRRALSPPQQRESILDMDFNGDGEDMVREILNRPYSTRHNDGSDSNKPFYGVRFSESDEGRVRVARGDPINMEASRAVIEEHDLEWTLIEEVEVDDDLSEDREDEVVRRVHDQGTWDIDAYSDPEGGSDGWKRSTPSVERANTTTTNGTHRQHPADLLNTLNRSNASPLAWDLPTTNTSSSSLQKRGETDWTCNRIGQRNTKEALLIMYDVFNDVFGTEPLRGLTNQCYVAECQDWYFSYCQMLVDVKEERPGARKKVIDRDPGKGGSCYAVADGENSNRYHRYFFGHVSANPIPNYGGGFNVRRCN